MAFVPIARAVQCNFIGVWNGQPAVTGFQLAMNSQPTITDAIELGGILAGWWGSEISGYLSNAYFLNQIDIIDLSNQAGFYVNHTNSLPDQGANTAPSLPNNVAMVVTFKTSQRGRAYRGRAFLPGFTEADSTGYTWNPLTTAAMEAAFEALETYFDPETWYHVVASRSTDPGFVTLVTDYLVRPTTHTQKRRLPTN